MVLFFILQIAISWTHSWKENNFAYGFLVCCNHDQSVYSQSPSGGWRHAGFKGDQKILLQRIVLDFVLLALVKKSLALQVWIVELGVSVDEFHTRDEELEPLREGRIEAVGLG